MDSHLIWPAVWLPAAQAYYALEECLGENKRDFRACKKEMEALKECSDRKNKVRAEPVTHQPVIKWFTISASAAIALVVESHLSLRNGLWWSVSGARHGLLVCASAKAVCRLQVRGHRACQLSCSAKDTAEEEAAVGSGSLPPSPPAAAASHRPAS